MIRVFLLFLLFFFSRQGQAQLGSLSGKVTDAKTGEALQGATVRLVGTDLGGVTDSLGYYTVRDIPPQRYNITASYVGYQSLTRYYITIKSGGNPELNFMLQEATAALDEVVITANPFDISEETPLSIQRLSREEIASYPGGNNDIAKVVQSLPGVSGSVGGFRNDVIIRGGAPNENVYYLDGIEIPNINHFATQGSAGGPVGLLNVSFFENVTLTASAFAAQYDNVLSGVLQFDQRKGNLREFKGNFRLGASESALTLEGPLFKKDKEVSNTSYIVSARRSYLKFLFDLIGLPISPDYWDFQFKVAHSIDEHNDLVITGIGSIDDFEINPLDKFDANQQAIQDQVPIIRQNTATTGISWKRRFRNNSGYLNATISTNLLRNTFSKYRNNINREGLYFNNDSREQETKFRLNFTQFLNQWTTAYGLSAQRADYSNSTQDMNNNFNYSTDLNFYRYGFYFQTSSSFLNNKLGFSAGIRADGNTFTRLGNALEKTLSPRISFAYTLSDRWTISTSAGRYYKLPPYTVLGFKSNPDIFVNHDSRYIRSDHLTGGVEYLISASSRISVEGFLKRYKYYPVSVTDSVSLANKGGGFEVLGNEPVVSVGRGRTYGTAFFFQQKFNGRYYAILAYTLYKSEFTQFKQDQFTASTWDNNHLISLTAGYRLGRNWEISSRFRFSGKAPYVPVDTQATLDNYPAIIKDYSKLGTLRLAPFRQLDIRADKTWNFKKFSLEVYLDLQNALAGSLPDEPQYGLARDRDGKVTVPRKLVIVNEDEGSALIPSIGVVIDF